jgi:hypothetical protein
MTNFHRGINSHILWGVMGALAFFLPFSLYAWTFTLGSTVEQLFEGWLILTPIALVIGVGAGVLSWMLIPQSSSFAFGFAVVAAIGGVFYAAPQLADYLTIWRAVNRELWLAKFILRVGPYPTALLIGTIIVELMIACLVFLWMKLSRFMRSRLKF